MRIAYTLQRPDILGGLERIILEKASALAEAGHTVCGVCNTPGGRPAAYPVHAAVQIIDLAMPEPTGPGWKWRQFRALRKALEAFAPDVVVMTPSWPIMAAIYGPGRLVLESHTNRACAYDTERHSAYKRLKTALGARRADVVVCLTAEDAGNWLRARRVEVIPNFTKIRPLPRHDGTHRFCAVGRLSPEKQLDLLLDAWASVAATHPDWALDIYGDGPERHALQQQIERLGLGEQAVLCGPTDDVARVYAGHEFVVLSSAREGFGLVLIEAMACGCPPVAVDCPCGPREIIHTGHDGILVPYRGLSREQRVQALARAIEEAMSGAPALREGARHTARRYSPRNVMSRVQNLFLSLR